MFVISGVTGNTGSIAAQALLDAGKKVRVIVRNDEKGQVWKDKGAEVAIAEFTDVPALTKALEGAEAAYLLLPPDLAHSDFINSRAKMADGLLKAAQDSKIPHVVFLSSVGAHHNEKTGPIRTVAYLERLFEKSSIKSTAVRPAYFLENWGAILPAVIHDSVLPSFLHPLDRKIDMVATQDIGETIAEALLNPTSANHHVIELQGAAQYSPHDVAQAFAKALNKDITPIAVPQEAWVPSLTQHGISRDIAGLFEEMYESVNNGFIDFTGQNTRKAKVSLDEFIQKLVA
jgi:uncharacterized protein YbjT (DUF2867 family)